METKQTLKNECNKKRKVDNPYEIWKTPDGSWEWRVLKKWQLDDDKPYARYFCAVKSPFTYGSWEYGDVYVKDIKENANRVITSKEFEDFDNRKGEFADPQKPEYDKCNAGHSLILIEGRGGKRVWDCPICIKKMQEAK